MYFYLSFNTIHLSQNSCIATQIVDMKMNIFLGRELIKLIVSPFSNLCLKTVLGFINNGDKCRFDSSTALKILQDGMLFNIMVVLVAYFLGCQLELCYNSQTSWFNFFNDLSKQCIQKFKTFENTKVYSR